MILILSQCSDLDKRPKYEGHGLAALRDASQPPGTLVLGVLGFRGFGVRGFGV